VLQIEAGRKLKIMIADRQKQHRQKGKRLTSRHSITINSPSGFSSPGCCHWERSLRLRPHLVVSWLLLKCVCV